MIRENETFQLIHQVLIALKDVLLGASGGIAVYLMVGRSGLLGFAGASAFKIMELVESRLANSLYERLTGKKIEEE